ncbi:MAG: hypothetical protein ACRCX5_05340 [Bacteroidales bacterium]
MIIDLTKGKNKRITIPMDMLSMGDVHDKLNMDCKRTGQTVMRTINSLGITLYKIGDFYFCSNSDIKTFGIGANVSRHLKSVLDVLKDGAKTRDEIATLLGIKRSSAYYRISKLIQFKLVHEKKTELHQKILSYVINPEIDEFYIREK